MGNLKELLNGVSSEKTFLENMPKIAEELLLGYQIKKGDIYYDIIDVEFYYYDSEHRDIITYPRIAKAGEWYFHNSGMDLCFNSEVHYLDNKHKKVDPLTSRYGGVLIRQIRRVDGKIFDGPQKSCYELFDKFDAFEQKEILYPLLVNKQVSATPIESKVDSRVIHITTDKIEGKLSALNAQFDGDLIQDREGFDEYIDKPYRFTIAKK